jgi:hypothetical protein
MAGTALVISGGGIGSCATSIEEQAASAAHPNIVAIIRIKNFLAPLPRQPVKKGPHD